jgi:hypothetical protein
VYESIESVKIKIMPYNGINKGTNTHEAIVAHRETAFLLSFDVGEGGSVFVNI